MANIKESKLILAGNLNSVLSYFITTVNCIKLVFLYFLEARAKKCFLEYEKTRLFLLRFTDSFYYPVCTNFEPLTVSVISDVRITSGSVDCLFEGTWPYHGMKISWWKIE